MTSWISSRYSAGARPPASSARRSRFRPRSREFGRYFVAHFNNGEKVAPILRDLRLSLLAKWNVLGLCYTPYCHGDLHLETDRRADPVPKYI